MLFINMENVDPDYINNNKVNLIKAIRQLSKCGLREAKDVAEGTRILKDSSINIINPDENRSKALVYLTSVHGIQISCNNEWESYEKELKEILFTAILKGHKSVEWHVKTLLNSFNSDDLSK